MSEVQGDNSVLALDVGEKRIGLAVASLVSRLPKPLLTLERDSEGGYVEELRHIVSEENVSDLVVGLPRNMNGEDTSQTETVRVFSEELKSKISLPVHLQDEAVTSVRAEEELKSRGKPYDKGDIDALSATYILEDYLTGLGTGRD